MYGKGETRETWVQGRRTRHIELHTITIFLFLHCPIFADIFGQCASMQLRECELLNDSFVKKYKRTNGQYVTNISEDAGAEYHWSNYN